MGFMQALGFGSRFKLDPERTRQAQAAYVTGGYDDWAARCCAEAPRAHEFESVLERDGFEVVTLLSPDEAAATKNAMLAGQLSASAAKPGIDYADVLEFENSAFLRPAVEKMLSPDIAARVTSIFGSEFYVHSLTANRTKPSAESKRSFLWHCDRGPRDFIKINMFLDATESHGGTTEFVNLHDSGAFERAGYTFGAQSNRVHDLSLIASKVGVTPNVVRPQLAAGQAFMFFPARTLHRGFLPSRGVRHMLSLVLLPSPIHWAEAWDVTVTSGFHDRSMATFPENANELPAILGLPHRAS